MASSPTETPPAPLTRRRFLARAALAGAGLLGAGWALRSNALEESDVSFALPGLRAPLRALFISDLHLPHTFIAPDAIAAIAEAFRPDLLVFGGDAFERGESLPLVSYLAGVAAPLGKLAILGNWERTTDVGTGALRAEYAKAGVHLLVNETVEVMDAAGGALRVVGLDDLMTGAPRWDLCRAPSKDASAGAAAALALIHCPAGFDELPHAPLLCLSGHTHGGQVGVGGLRPFVPPFSGRYVHGAYDGPGGRRLYVSRGLGNSVVRFRLGARPEAVRMTLTPA